MNILITGGTGFLGSHLASALLENNKIGIIARGIRSSYLTLQEMKKVGFIKCDLLDKDSLKEKLPANIDLVIHCSGMINIRPDGRYSDGLIKSNLDSTINLIEAMIDKGIKNFIFSSSMTVYGINNAIPVKENGILEPVHFYGLSKKWAEEIILNYAAKGFIRALILRYPGLYGYPREDGYIYNTTRKLLKEEGVVINTLGLKFWETINVDDGARITKNLIETSRWEKNFEIVNCGYGEEIDFVSTAFKIKEIVKSKSPIEVKKPLDYIKFYMDNQKLKSLMDFSYNFEKSLRDFINKHKDWLQK